MPSIRRILVAIKNTDSRTSPAAVKAAQLARGLGARLELFHAIETPVYLDAVMPRRGQLKQIRKQKQGQHLRGLQRFADVIRQRGLRERAMLGRAVVFVAVIVAMTMVVLVVLIALLG